MVIYPEWQTLVEGRVPRFDRVISRSISSWVCTSLACTVVVLTCSPSLTRRKMSLGVLFYAKTGTCQDDV
jgi:hypothetical protein